MPVTWLQPLQQWQPWPQIQPLLIALALWKEKYYWEGAECIQRHHRYRLQEHAHFQSGAWTCKSSYSAGWSAPSCLLPRESPASSSDSASHLPSPPCPPRCPPTWWRWPPSPHLQTHRSPHLTYRWRKWSLRRRRRKQLGVRSCYNTAVTFRRETSSCASGTRTHQWECCVSASASAGWLEGAWHRRQDQSARLLLEVWSGRKSL